MNTALLRWARNDISATTFTCGDAPGPGLHTVWRLWKAPTVTDVAGAVSPVLGGLVRELDRAAPTDLVEVCRTWVVQNLGVQECALLLADYSETTLEPVPDAEARDGVAAA